MSQISRSPEAIAAIEAAARAEVLAAINAERDRRLAGGFDFVVRGTTHRFQSDDVSIKRITGAATLAGFAVGAGAAAGDFLWPTGATSPFSWITLANVVVQLDAHETFALGQAAANHEQAHVFAAFNLKAQDPPPSDPTDDALWP